MRMPVVDATSGLGAADCVTGDNMVRYTQEGVQV